MVWTVEPVENTVLKKAHDFIFVLVTISKQPVVVAYKHSNMFVAIIKTSCIGNENFVKRFRQFYGKICVVLDFD